MNLRKTCSKLLSGVAFGMALAVGNVMSYPGIWDIEDGRDGTSGNKSRISGSSLRMEYFPMMDITQWESILRNTLI